MSVSNGQNANETTFNNGLMSRTDDTSTVGKVDLKNTDPLSGAEVDNIQRELNAVESFTGLPAASIKTVKPVWTSNDAGLSTDALKLRADNLSAKFNAGAGHAHGGGAGDGAPILAASIASVRLKGSFVAGLSQTAITGTTLDVSGPLAAKTHSTGDTVEGLAVSFPNNMVILRDAAALTPGDDIKSAAGDTVFGRLTWAAGVWTLSFFTNIGGVETAYALAAQDFAWYYQALFNPLTNAPIYSDLASVPSDNATQDVIDADATHRGLISAGAQSIGGNKTFTGAVAASNLSGTNTGDYDYGLQAVGTRAAPTVVTAAGGVAAPTKRRTLAFIAGFTASLVVTANPQIAAGNAVGDEMTLRVPVGSNTVILSDGTGLSQNGAFELGFDVFAAHYVWDGTEWFLVGKD